MFKIYRNETKLKNDKKIATYLSWDFAGQSGYEVFLRPNNNLEFSESEKEKYFNYHEVIANEIPNKETALQIAIIFSKENNIAFGGDLSPLH